MKLRRHASSFVLAFMVIPMTTGCELITKVDRSEIDDGSNLSSSSSSSSSSVSSSGMGGSGGMGMGGAGGMGGGGSGGGVISCVTDANCDDGNSCSTETCENEACVFTVLDGVPTPGVMDKPGDCRKPQCIAGIDTATADDLDVPNDGIECTTEACSNGTPQFTNVAEGTACGAMMDLVCNGNGVCVGCTTPNDCQGQDSICQTRTCIAATCGVQNAPAGTFVDGAQSGDCKQTQCNGAGGLTTGPDNTDLPADDGSQCTNEICSNGMPFHPFANAGTACNQNGGSQCNGAGACVECLVATDCPGQDTECQTRTCLMNKCGVDNAPAGTLISSQTAGDCGNVVCNGMGGTTTAIDNADVPSDDGNQCTNDTCSNGVPVHPAKPDQSSCMQNGGSLCSAGMCVQCIAASDCPGQDTECAIRTCNTNTCGMNFTAAGTALSSQTAGDCKENRCDGMGNVTSAIDNADLPNDSLECTDDICSGGVPQNPPLPLRTACSQNGGTVCNGAGVCAADVTVVATNPADAQTNTPVDSTIRVTFSTAMNPATLTGQTAHGPCSGSIQVSADGFNTCWAFTSASPVMTGGGTIATFTPAGYFSNSSTYKIRVKTSVQSTASIPLATQYDHPAGFTTAPPVAPCGGSVVISQVYGAGGSLGAVLKNDFVELHNRGNTPVNVTGWSIQYAYPTGSFNSAPNHTTPLTGIIPAGGYYLVQFAGDGGGSADLPTAEVIGNTDLIDSSGKVALVNTTTPLTGGCPNNASIVDFVGYGIFTNCFEGSSAAPTPSAVTIAVTRINGGCTDSADNNADFSSNTANPRNTSSPTNICPCGANATTNETGRADELDYCNIQFPPSITVTAGQATPTIYGRVYEAGITDPAGADASIRAEIGYGPANVNPSSQSGFNYVPATFNMQYGNDDEYQAVLMAPATPGSYRYVARFSLDGVGWTYCDPDGAGSNPGLTFNAQTLPVLTVNP